MAQRILVVDDEESIRFTFDWATATTLPRIIEAADRIARSVLICCPLA